MSIIKLFSIFYHGCIRQEADCTWCLKMLHLKRFNLCASIYECTEEEFHKLLRLCQEVEMRNPKALSLDAGISYRDPLDKKIGKHAFMYEFVLTDQQIEEFAAQYYPDAC